MRSRCAVLWSWPLTLTLTLTLTGRRALVALAVRRPVELAEFLTSEFYGNAQSLEMRMEALQVMNSRGSRE